MNEFPHVVCRFLADLKASNNKPWFEANRKRYETEWLEPAVRFVSSLRQAMEALDPPHRTEARVNGSIRRIHRDVRFSRDKTPFDPRLHMVFWTGDHPNRSPAIHLVLHADRAGAGVGQFALTKEELTAYRRAVADDPGQRAELVSLLGELGAQDVHLTGESLKRAPLAHNLPPEHETLLKRKGLVVKTGEDGMPLDALVDTGRMESFFRTAARLNGWLIRNTA